MKVTCTAGALRIRSLPLAAVGTDTGKRMILDQVAGVYGKSTDGQWLYIDAPAGRGWSHGDYLKEVEENHEVLVSPSWPKVPTGRAEIERVFGGAGGALASSGRVPLPEPLKLGWAETRVSAFACHKLMEDVFDSVFNTIHSRGYWDLLETFDGCYNYRTVTSSQKVSVHSWGIGVDLNASTNRLGATPTMDRRIIGVFEDHGFVWGGNWSRPDGMHFQFAKNY